MDRAAREVDDVCGARAVDVDQPDAPAVEQIRSIEPRRAVHDDLGAESTITLVRPIADLAVANADQIREAVARHVGQEDRLGAIGEDEPRAAFVVGGLQRPLSWTEAPLAECLVPRERLAVGHQDVRKPVARQVDEPEIGIPPVEIRQRRERRECRPMASSRAFVPAPCRTVQIHEIEPPVARQVHQLLPSAAERRRRRHVRHDLEGREAGRGDARAVDLLVVGGAVVRLVEPAAALFGEDAGRSFAIEVDPPIPRRIESAGEILEAVRVDVTNRFVDRRRAVGEVERRQAAGQIAADAVAAIGGLRDRLQKRVRRLDRIGRRWRVREIGRADEAVDVDRRLAAEVVEHQRAPAQTIGAHLEPAAMRGEGVHPAGPRRTGIRWHGRIDIVFAVVEDHLEAPIRGKRCGRRGGEVGKVGRAVAVENPLQVRVGRAGQVGAIPLVCLREIHAVRIFALVAVDDDVARVVVAFADQPSENACGIVWIGDAGVPIPAVPRRDVVPGDRAPESIESIVRIDPALDARKEALDPRPIAVNGVPPAVHRPEARQAGHDLLHPSGPVVDEGRHQILGARQHERVGFAGVVVPRHSLVRLARDRRQREPPAEAERAIAAAGVVGEAKLRSEAGTPRARGDRDAQRGGPSGRVGGELLANPANRATALRQGERGSRACALGGRGSRRREERPNA